MNLISIDKTMSSREIAKLTGKEHKHVIRDINVMVASLGNDGPKMGHVIFKEDSRGYVAEVLLPKRETLILVSGYNVEMRARIVDRWLELEQREVLREEQKLSRAAARLEAPALTEALKSNREALGKETKPHHYSNEFNMINRVALGATAKQVKEELELAEGESLRDHLTPEQIKCIEHLQRLNTSLIEIGMGYDDRKQKLTEVYARKYEAKLLDEILRLEG